MKIYSHPSPTQGSRIRYLILHYTAAGIKTSIQLLAGNDVQISAPYLISDTPDHTGEILIDELVKPEQRELMIADQPSVALSPPSYQEGQGKHWFHFPKEQIAALIELAGPLVKQYHIEPTRVVGHADIAPSHKQDPGPLFPWYTLAHEEIGAWPRAAVVEYYEKRLKERPLTLTQQQAALKQYGYEIPTHGVLDPKTKNTIASFQMHFSPTDYLGNMDDSTQAVLCALVEDYCPQARDTLLGAQLPSSGVNGPAINSQQFLESIHSPVVESLQEMNLGAQLASLGMSAVEIEKMVSYAKKTNNMRLFEFIASYPADEAAQPGVVTASKDQLFKPAGLCQLLNLT